MPSLFVEVAWQPFPESQNIEVDPFLKDAETLMRLVDLLGTQMKPVRSDMLGNINKINESHKKHCPDKEFLHEVIEYEVELGISKKDPSASVGMLWLKRGIEYFYEFLKIIAEEYEAGTLGESISEVARRAYDRTLKSHHNWIMKKTFSMVSHLTPKKATLIKNLTQDDPALIATLTDDMRVFLDSLKPYLDKLNELVAKYELN